MYEKVLQQQISKAEEKYSEVISKFEKLKMFSNIKEMENQLSDVQRKMVDVKSAFGYIDVIKIKYIEEVKNIHIVVSYNISNVAHIQIIWLFYFLDNKKHDICSLFPYISWDSFNVLTRPDIRSNLFNKHCHTISDVHVIR